jgi:hypothetical protein
MAVSHHGDPKMTTKTTTEMIAFFGVIGELESVVESCVSKLEEESVSGELMLLRPSSNFGR